MPTAFVTHTSFLEAREEAGVVSRLVTRSRVVELTSTSVDVLDEALSASGVPVNGDKLATYPELVVTQRNVQLLEEGENTVADVDVTYEHFKNDVQSYSSPAAGTVLGEVSANVQSLTTNKDLFGNDIVLEHTYQNDPNHPNGLTEEQTGTVPFFQAQKTIVFRGIKETLFPWVIADQLIGAVNSIEWQGGEVHSWMCTGVNWEILDDTNQYRMSFEFQHNPDTWNPTAVFIDGKTNKPPKNLVEGTGFKTIRVHREVDFEAVVGLRLQGG